MIRLRQVLVIIIYLIVIFLPKNLLAIPIDVTSTDPLPNSFTKPNVTFLCDSYGNNCEGGTFNKYIEGGYIHTGLDLDLDPSYDYEVFYNRVVSTLPGQVVDIKTNVTCTDCSGFGISGGNYVVLKHLLDDGRLIYSIYGHLLHMDNDQQAAGLEIDDFFVPGSSFIGYKGSTGKSTGSHLHFEISNIPDMSSTAECAEHWYPACNNPSRLNPAERSNQVEDPAPFRNGGRRVLTPNLYRNNENPEPNTYDVFGINNENLCASLTLTTSEYREFTNIGVGGRPYNNESDIQDIFIFTRSIEIFNDSISRTISGCSSFQVGDYKFFAESDQFGDGYPIKFTILKNQNSVIVDNDQIDNGGYQYFQNTGNGQRNLVQGYYYSSQLVKGQSDTIAQWKPNIYGTYRIYVHIPKGLPSNGSAENVIYRIEVDGTDENQQLARINQRECADQWAPLIVDENNEYVVDCSGNENPSTFEFTQAGYVEIGLGTDINDLSSNSHIDSNTWVSFDAVKFEFIGINIDTALIIDSSGSMGWNDPQDLRKDAAKAFVDTANDDDQIAIIDFDSYSYVPWSLQPLTANRDGIKSAIDSIDSWGGTNISSGLLTGYNELDSSTQPYKKAAVLLTDGQGYYNNEADLYQDRGWPIYTIGLGSSTNPVLLQNIADVSGGKYFQLTSALQLTKVYFEIATEIAGGKVISYTTTQLEQSSFWETIINIPPLQEIINFFANWGGSEVDMTLVTPTGVVINPSTQDTNIYHAKGLTYELYRINNPEAGEWMVQLYGTDIPVGGETVNISVSAIGPEAIPGDLDGDGDIGFLDFQILRSVFGKCVGTAGFIPDADYDEDGCITYADYRTWYGYYRNQ